MHDIVQELIKAASKHAAINFFIEYQCSVIGGKLYYNVLLIYLILAVSAIMLMFYAQP